jgi:energy-coupling factor transporter ATP-binding protein EcfA2
VIRLERVTVTYPDAAEPTIRDVDLHVEEGELCLVVGPTGVGKSTLLGCLNGLVPHFTGGTLRGRVTVAGRSTAASPPRELAEVVGVVGQDPIAGFVTDTVEEELAYAMEQLAVPPDVMRKRVEETLDLLGIADLRHRALRTLSGGQQQRVAIGSVLTAHPRVLVLDEPTSALDPTAAEDVLASITRLVHDLGVTVVVAEHRLERVAPYADRVVVLHGDGSVRSGPAAETLAASPVAPPVVELGRLAGWSPLPLSVRDARRAAQDLRERLVTAPPPYRPPLRSDEPVLRTRRLRVAHGPIVAVRDVDLALHAGEVVALMGRNGSGKSSLMWAVQGAGPRSAGDVSVIGPDGRRTDTAGLPPAEARRRVGLVPQTPGDLLYLPTVAEECAQADVDAGRPAGTCDALLARLVPDIRRDAHPRDLSEGQRLSLVLAIQLTASPSVVLLDEPTRGLDYRAKTHLAAVLRELADAGHAVMVSTHDVEFVASSADRVVVMAQGEVVADGRTAEVVVASPAFAPQVAKVLSPERYLTVDEVRRALALPTPSPEAAPC